MCKTNRLIHPKIRAKVEIEITTLKGTITGLLDDIHNYQNKPTQGSLEWFQNQLKLIAEEIKEHSDKIGEV